MQNYLDLLRDILDNGTTKEDRTGIGSRSVWGRSLRWNLEDGFPIVTTRKVSFRIAFEETMFFLRGETNTKLLEDKNVNIWKENTTREFLDKRGLTTIPEGDMGKGYGFQWRRFGEDSLNEVIGVDQIKQLMSSLKNDPYSRRHIVIAWNPMQLDDMALPPCHLYQQYQVMDNKLNSSFILRSNDALYGLPYNIMSYALLNYLFSKLHGYQPGELVFFGNDVHLYNNQIELAKEQIQRTPTSLPKLHINKDINTLDDILSLEFNDLYLEGYNPLPDFKNKPSMAI